MIEEMGKKHLILIGPKKLITWPIELARPEYVDSKKPTTGVTQVQTQIFLSMLEILESKTWGESYQISSRPVNTIYYTHT